MTRERCGAASGYLVIALGIAGAAFERGSPPANAPVEQSIAYFATYRAELLAQSLAFVLSAGAYLWFYAHLRGFLAKAEGGAATLSAASFGAGIASVSLQLIMQTFQTALALSAGGGLDPKLAGLFSGLMWAISVIAYVPLVVVLGAVAVVSLRDGAFPAWLGWFSALGAIAHLVMTAGLVVTSGPLVPGGGLTYALYGLLLLWLIAATTVMVARSGGTPPADAGIRVA